MHDQVTGTFGIGVEPISKPMNLGNLFRSVGRRAVLVQALILTLIPCLTLAAEDDEALGRFRDWYAVAYAEGEQRICYMASQPTVSEGEYTRRGPAYVQVTRRGGEKGPDVVSFEAGYPFKEGTEVEVAIDGVSHALFADGATAWAYDTDGDAALARAMARGTRMVVKGVSRRGTTTIDTYSLMGFMAAQRAIAQACGN
jgi:hypothetical protein